jgi:hypothetical protein
MELSHGRILGTKASLPYHGVGMWRHTLAYILIGLLLKARNFVAKSIGLTHREELN